MSLRPLLAVALTALLVVTARGMTIVLRFDGSLRPPTDTVPGFTYSPITFDGDGSTRPVEGNDKFASCSAAISILDDGGERLVALGGRYLPNDVPGRTSADAEYDGLLLGLEWLVEAFSSGEESTFGILHRSSDEHDLLASSELVVRGDCKAVIDQMNSRSVPRKTKAKHQLAVGVIESLTDAYAECQRTAARTNIADGGCAPSQDLRVSFEHVSRGDNALCDAMCNLIVRQKQAEMVQSIQDTIRLGEEEVSNRTDNDDKTRLMKKRRKKGAIQPQSEHLELVLDGIRRNPRLCHSSRLALACELVNACVQTKDTAILGGCGDFFTRMSRVWPRVYFGDDGLEKRDALKKAGIECEKLSKQFASGVDDNDRERKSVGQVLEFFAPSRGKCVADSSASAMNISAIISGVDKGGDLKAWQKLASANSAADSLNGRCWISPLATLQ